MDQAVEILLVEDSDEDAELTLRALRNHNLANNLHRIVDGADALDFLFGRGAYEARRDLEAPRVVLLDLKLPTLGGLDVLRQLKASPTTKNIPVVVLTSSDEDSDLKSAYSLGANSYIVKPVEFEKFATAIGSLGLYWVLLNQPR